MPSLKKSVMLSEQTQKYIHTRTKNASEIAWSQALNNAFNALQWLSTEALPNLSDTEWQTALNVYNGSIIDFVAPLRIASDMMDNVGAENPDELTAEYMDLVKKMAQLSQVEQFAVLDFVQKFWCGNWDDCADFSEIADRIRQL